MCATPGGVAVSIPHDEEEMKTTRADAARAKAEAEAVTITEDDKLGSIRIWSFAKPHMRGLHLGWLAFFMAFVAWFAPAPLASVIKKTLHLKKKQILIANFSAVTTTIVARIAVGPMTDKYGPKVALTVLLLLGAIPVFCLGSIKTWKDLVATRAAIGILGATFVPAQAWTTLMFKKSVVGSANAIVGGWGNLGGGFTQFFMTDVFESFKDRGMTAEQAWRTSFYVPACMLIVTAAMVYFLGVDTPKGDVKDLKKRGYVPQKASSSMRAALSEPATWLLMIQYAMSFGVELVVFNMAEMYFHETFKVSMVQAGHVASLGGIGNIVTRAAGGMLSDWANWKFDGMKARLAVQTILLLLEGCLLIWFSNVKSYNAACILLLSFSVFVQMANGSCFGIVPYVNTKSMGSVSGLVGAGGNVGAMVFSLAFIYGHFPDLAYGFRMMGYTVLAVACTTWLIRPAEGDYRWSRELQLEQDQKKKRAIDNTMHSTDDEEILRKV